MGRLKTFDWDGINEVTLEPSTVDLSGMSRALILSALSLMLERWRWTDDTDWDDIEVAVSSAVVEVMEDSA